MNKERVAAELRDIANDIENSSRRQESSEAYHVLCSNATTMAGGAFMEDVVSNVINGKKIQAIKVLREFYKECDVDSSLVEVKFIVDLMQDVAAKYQRAIQTLAEQAAKGGTF